MTFRAKPIKESSICEDDDHDFLVARSEFEIPHQMHELCDFIPGPDLCRGALMSRRHTAVSESRETSAPPRQNPSGGVENGADIDISKRLIDSQF
jgi:hypothetical protein